jgi:hypothetical protein|eukprot:COSAG01_NODE_2025_length_8604_cov_16.296296_8_plen_221_part_00
MLACRPHVLRHLLRGGAHAVGDDASVGQVKACRAALLAVAEQLPPPLNGRLEVVAGSAIALALLAACAVLRLVQAVAEACARSPPQADEGIEKGAEKGRGEGEHSSENSGDGQTTSEPNGRQGPQSQSSSEARKTVSRLDRNHDGVVSLDEFMAGQKSRNATIASRTNARVTFGRLDGNHDGVLNVDEVAKGIQIGAIQSYSSHVRVRVPRLAWQPAIDH